MNNLKLYAVMILLLSTGFKVRDIKPELTKWVIESGCSLKVAGKTNVNKFSCTIFNYAKPDTLTFYRNNTGAAVKVAGSISVDVQQFDCQHNMITRDLRKTLKSATFPKLVIKFINLSKYPEFSAQTQSIKGLVSIELAGVTKQYEVDYRFIPDGTKSLTLIGNRQVNFSDFDLTPPKKAGGMIKTKDQLDVEFNLKLKVI